MIRASIVAALVLASCLTHGTASAQATEPLLMEGKSRLFQRVLIRTATNGADSPGGAGREPLAPLTPLYVYARDGDWLQVGRDDRGGALRWIPAADAVDWRQNIVVTFEPAEGVGRLLFFGDLDGVYDVVESEDPARAAAALRAEAEAAEADGTRLDTIVALGPRETIDLRSNLYVMPILEAEEAIFESGTFVNLLRVAVARADPDGAAPTPAAPVPPPSGDRADFRAAIVFVIDTTISMGPFIDATAEALESIFGEVSAARAGEAVSFGLVGFRDNLTASGASDYDVQTFMPLAPGPQAERFLEAIDSMEESEISNKDFREDSYAGIRHAMETLDWSGYGARFIVLVTDAGPREAGDDLSMTGLSARGLSNLVTERLGASVAVLHLRTPGGGNDHASAEAAYRELSQRPNQDSLYFPIEQGDPGEYNRQARRLAELIVQQVDQFRNDAAPQDFAAEPDDPMAAALRSAGRTMQLAYLGRIEGTEAPDVFEAVVADRDFERTGLKPLSIRLLLNKNQLSDLQQALQLIIAKAEENVIDPQQFFQQVLGAAADMSRRPEDVSARASDASLAEAAAIDEYLEGLPYASRIMSVTGDDWLRMTIAEQQSIVNGLYDKIARYQSYNEATDQWVDYLGAGGGADTLLYPMPLDDLP